MERNGVLTSGLAEHGERFDVQERASSAAKPRWRHEYSPKASPQRVRRRIVGFGEPAGKGEQIPIPALLTPAGGDPAQVDQKRAHRVAGPRQRASPPGAGLTERQVDYWAGIGLVEPAVDTRLSAGRRVRLYGFIDLLALLVAAKPKNRKVSLQHIRAIVNHLRSRGYTSPLTQLTFATVVVTSTSGTRTAVGRVACDRTRSSSTRC